MAKTTSFACTIVFLLYFTFNVFGNEVIFSNTWAVKILGGNRVILEKLASKHGFVNTTQVSEETGAWLKLRFVRKKEQRINRSLCYFIVHSSVMKRKYTILSQIVT